MNIIILASAARSGGALTIYRQFLSYLPQFVGNHKWYLFVDPAADKIKVQGVKYIEQSNHSWSNRILWDSKGLKKWLRNNRIVADVIVSLQNTGSTITSCRQIIYYHQSIPFYNRKWNLLVGTERLMWLYKYIYPLFVKRTLTDKTDVVVQIPFIGDGFQKRFKFDKEKIHILFPDIERIDTKLITEYPLKKDCYHFIYPANTSKFKEHKTLAEAVSIIKKENAVLASKIRIHLTFTEKENFEFVTLINKMGIQKQFILGGTVDHNILLSMYKSSIGLLFPSTIETLGLPLLEASQFGLPIVVSNIPYAKEVISSYEGAKFINPYDYEAWAKAIESLCLGPKKYLPLEENNSTWPQFFQLILGN